MFAALIKKAEATVEGAVNQAVGRVIMVVPFVVAAGFALAALSFWLNRSLGPELGNLIIATMFCVIGAITVSIVKSKSVVSPDAAAEPEEPLGAADRRRPMSEAERELLAAAVSTATPIALPHLVRLALRNLPLLAVVGAVLLVLGRASADDRQPNADVTAPQAAE